MMNHCYCVFYVTGNYAELTIDIPAITVFFNNFFLFFISHAYCQCCLSFLHSMVKLNFYHFTPVI